MDKRRIQLRWFEAGVALAVIAAFAAIGPFRATFVPIPWVMVLSTLVLFLTPGVLLVRWFLRDYFFGAALAPAAFVTSVGLFALMAVPMLILQSTLAAYLWACGTVVAACWLAAVVLTFRPEQSEEGQTGVALSGGGLL
jgi:polyferredoxin